CERVESAALVGGGAGRDGGRHCGPRTRLGDELHLAHDSAHVATRRRRAPARPRRAGGAAPASQALAGGGGRDRRRGVGGMVGGGGYGVPGLGRDPVLRLAGGPRGLVSGWAGEVGMKEHTMPSRRAFGPTPLVAVVLLAAALVFAACSNEGGASATGSRVVRG